MTPVGTEPNPLSGAWWPWSDDPEAEFPRLLAGLDPWVGQVGRVYYHLDLWGELPRRILVGGQAVRCEGFHVMYRHTLVVMGKDRRRVVLLVVPPDTEGGVARAAMKTAADPGSTAGAQEILVGYGVPLNTRHGSPTSDGAS